MCKQEIVCLSGINFSLALEECLDKYFAVCTYKNYLYGMMSEKKRQSLRPWKIKPFGILYKINMLKNQLCY